jgi:hypothetical protein
MLACSFQVYDRTSFDEYKKQFDFSIEDSMLDPAYESHSEIHMVTEADEMYAISNVTAEEADLGSSINETKTKKSFNVKRQTQQILPCVNTESELRIAVKAAPNGLSTDIALCAANIFLSDKIDPVSKITGIDITNKVINVICGLSSNRRCILDGADQSRIFFCKNATLSVVLTNFVKGSTKNDCDKCVKVGGAIFLTDNSSLSLDRSSFINNHAGGAIYIEESSLVIKGRSIRSAGSIFTKNYAWRGGAISAHFSTITCETGIVIFKDNGANFKAGAINIADSYATLKDVKFYKNEVEKASKLLRIFSLICFTYMNYKFLLTIFRFINIS